MRLISDLMIYMCSSWSRSKTNKDAFIFCLGSRNLVKTRKFLFESVSTFIMSVSSSQSSSSSLIIHIQYIKTWLHIDYDWWINFFLPISIFNFLSLNKDYNETRIICYNLTHFLISIFTYFSCKRHTVERGVIKRFSRFWQFSWW